LIRAMDADAIGLDGKMELIGFDRHQREETVPQ
jgi:hypothetical protein